MSVATMQARARDLPVPASKGWQHAQSGIILMPVLAGLTRTELSDATAGEFDVTARYEAADKSVITTLFLFHPAAGDAALWFDRARTALETSDALPGMSPASATPVAFAAPGATAASSLRQVYASPGGQFRSTALAVVPVGGWLVVLRMTAPVMTAAQLSERMDQVIAGVRWPAGSMTAARAAVPVAACPQPLRYAKARVVKPDLADMMIAGLVHSGRVAKQDKTTVPAQVTWCRDGVGERNYGVYRSGDASGGYAMALGDAGRVISVEPSLMAQINKTGVYSVTLSDVDGSVSTFPSFDRMPSPTQVWSAIAGGKPTSRTQGNTTTVHSGAL
ncbi:hypothetical protein [Sphingomonas sp. Mn802worker]|uniref:hypothetical protein n=1 Tax=Sphingomonas sp. Mn802worker TaxID=629773 RepID=UPI001EE6FABA|nr:hypothetical protein [Sphingomonas sp. Mn802worker]